LDKPYYLKTGGVGVVRGGALCNYTTTERLVFIINVVHGWSLTLINWFITLTLYSEGFPIYMHTTHCNLVTQNCKTV